MSKIKTNISLGGVLNSIERPKEYPPLESSFELCSLASARSHTISNSPHPRNKLRGIRRGKINLLELSVKRWQEYKNIRLEALQNDPTAFSSSYEEHVDLSKRYWQEDLKNKRFIFAASGDSLVAMIQYEFERRVKLQHVANIFGVYVKKEYRGKGIGSLLLKEALKRVKQNSRIKKVKLAVITQQKPAINLYQKHGFKIVGRLKRELQVNGKFYDELVMERIITVS